jgi:biopolymer transport protein ExbB
MLYEAYLDVLSFMERGGDVLWFIAAVTFLMWSLIIERMWYFFRDHKDVIREASEKWEDRPERQSWTASAIRDQLISQASERIVGTFPLILTCVQICPLLGLLGTVTGMVSVFDAMAMQGGNARSMAAGVSMATIPTMAGMVASLAGLVGSTMLKRRIDFEIELFQDHLTMDH